MARATRMTVFNEVRKKLTLNSHKEANQRIGQIGTTISASFSYSDGTTIKGKI